jgi:hypothetical protein
VLLDILACFLCIDGVPGLVSSGDLGTLYPSRTELDRGNHSTFV